MVYELYLKKAINKRALKMTQDVQGITHSKIHYIKMYKLKQNKKRKKEKEARTEKQNYDVKVKKLNDLLYWRGNRNQILA